MNENEKLVTEVEDVEAHRMGPPPYEPDEDTEGHKVAPLHMAEDVEGHVRMSLEPEEDVEGHMQPPRDLDIER